MPAWEGHTTLNCPTCKIPLSFVIWKSTKPNTWSRRADCKVCHGRIYGEVGAAIPKTAATVKGKLYCDCCHFEADKLFPVDTPEWQMVCSQCKDCISDAQEMEQILNARLRNG